MTQTVQNHLVTLIHDSIQLKIAQVISVSLSCWHITGLAKNKIDPTFKLLILKSLQIHKKMQKQSDTCALQPVSPNGSILHPLQYQNQEVDISTMCVYSLTLFYHMFRVIQPQAQSIYILIQSITVKTFLMLFLYTHLFPTPFFDPGHHSFVLYLYNFVIFRMSYLTSPGFHFMILSFLN